MAASRRCADAQAPGRKRRLTPEQEARLVQRVKAGATPRDGVASLRGRQIQGILDREFGKSFSLNGTYKLLKRHGFVCLDPRPIHPRQDPVAADRRSSARAKVNLGVRSHRTGDRLVDGHSVP